MSEYTKGPWFAVKNSAYWEIKHDGAGEDGTPWSVGDVCASAPGDADGGLQEANARLIAAAPDNYECNVELAKIVRELCASYGHPLPQASLDRSDSAIAKATGEQND